MNYLLVVQVFVRIPTSPRRVTFEWKSTGECMDSPNGGIDASFLLEASALKMRAISNAQNSKKAMFLKHFDRL
ncbi:hypothetical protein Cthiooxydans_24520 [Comamonas thiooxydans]|nr:hypothetical protein Cthiooxydans_24520 [Comamonas thiooxydans]